MNKGDAADSPAKVGTKYDRGGDGIFIVTEDGEVKGKQSEVSGKTSSEFTTTESRQTGGTTEYSTTTKSLNTEDIKREEQ